MTGNCIITRNVFLRVDTPSTNKTNKFNPYNLIKTKWYISWFVYALYSVTFEHSVMFSICVTKKKKKKKKYYLRHRSNFFDGYQITQFFNQYRKTCYLKNEMIKEYGWLLISGEEKPYDVLSVQCNITFKNKTSSFRKYSSNTWYPFL
jgi:hypothetical protein